MHHDVFCCVLRLLVEGLVGSFITSFSKLLESGSCRISGIGFKAWVF